jgi:hypothetical protein
MITISQNGILVMAHSSAAICKPSSVASAQTAPAHGERSVLKIART